MEIITSMPNIETFRQCLEDNPCVFIVKMGAKWCGPCKRIETFLQSCYSAAPENVQLAVLDVDECESLYGFLKSKKVVSGVPAILVYYKGNTHYIPDDVVIGADIPQINLLFQRSYTRAIKELV